MLPNKSQQIRLLKNSFDCADYANITQLDDFPVNLQSRHRTFKGYPMRLAIFRMRLLCSTCFIVLACCGSKPLLSQQSPLVEQVESQQPNLADRVTELESELRQLQEQLAAQNGPAVPDAAAGMATVGGDVFSAGGCDAFCNGCAQCCGIKEAPCIECPRISTLSPYFNVSVFGAFKLDTIFSEPRAVSPGTPFFLAPDSPLGFDQNTVSIHARQSTLGAAFTGPQFGGFQSGGLFTVMFFNDNVVLDQYGILPLQAFGELKNERWRFAAGLQFDVFAPGLPTVLPFSALAASGNGGNSFRGQIRLERFIKPARDRQWTLQMALSEPITTTIDPAFRLSEDNGWPNFESRIALGLGTPQVVGLTPRQPFEVGISSVVGQLRTTEPLVRSVEADVWGISMDFRWAINPGFGFAGEFFHGQGLGTYNASILQTVNVDTLTPANSTLQSIRSTGGWFETYLYWTQRLHSHVGFGIDDPLDRDVAIQQRTQNSTVFANCLWDINQTFRIGLEYTYRNTKYQSPTLLDGEGSAIQTQFQWAF